MNWEIENSIENMGLQVRINGKYVMDAETGKPAVYEPPRHLVFDQAAMDLWEQQLKNSISRMARLTCE